MLFPFALGKSDAWAVKDVAWFFADLDSELAIRVEQVEPVLFASYPKGSAELCWTAK